MRRFRLVSSLAAARLPRGHDLRPRRGGRQLRRAPRWAAAARTRHLSTGDGRAAVLADDLPRLQPDSGRGEDFDCATFHVTSGRSRPGFRSRTRGSSAGLRRRRGATRLSHGHVRQDARLRQDAVGRPIHLQRQPAVQRLVVATPLPPDANIGQAYTAPALTASGGDGQLMDARRAARCPPGLTLGANGTISGTPTQSGTFSFTVQANGSPNNDTKQLSIFVVAPLELQARPTASRRRQPGSPRKKLSTPRSRPVSRPSAAGRRTSSARRCSARRGSTSMPRPARSPGRGTTAGTYTSTITVKDQAGAKQAVPSSSSRSCRCSTFVQGQGAAGRARSDRLYSARVPVSGKDARTAQFAVSGRIPPGLELDEDDRLPRAGTLLKAGIVSGSACTGLLGEPARRSQGLPRSRVQRVSRGSTLARPGSRPGRARMSRCSRCADSCSSPAPALDDPNFRRTVVLIGEHGDDGAMGVVLNRLSGVTVEDAVPPIAALAAPGDLVYVGGPVQPQAVVVLADFVDPGRAETLVVESVGFVPGRGRGRCRDRRAARRPRLCGVRRLGPGTARGRARGGLVGRASRPAADVFTTRPERLWSEVLRREGGGSRCSRCFPTIRA